MTRHVEGGHWKCERARGRMRGDGMQREEMHAHERVQKDGLNGVCEVSRGLMETLHLTLLFVCLLFAFSFCIFC
jgi:hypothetical protein